MKISEQDALQVAIGIMTMLQTKFPDGFTKNAIDKAFDGFIYGNAYTVFDEGDKAALIIRVKDGSSVELYMDADKSKYKLNGEYHIASDAKMSAAIETLVLAESVNADGLVIKAGIALEFVDGIANYAGIELDRTLFPAKTLS